MATKSAVRGGRSRIFVVNEPGAGRKWFTWLYLPDGSSLPGTELVTKKVAMADAKELARLYAPASVIEQRKDTKTGRYLWAEVYSTPRVPDGDER